MSEDQEVKAPKPAVEQTREEAPLDHAEGSVSTKESGEGFFTQSIENLKAWMAKTFPGNEHVVAGGLIGFLIALFVFVVGIWRTLIIALFVLVGVATAQYLDGDPKILKSLHRFIMSRRRR